MNFMCRMCLLCCCTCDWTLKGTDSNKSNLKIIDEWFPKTMPSNFISTFTLCITFAQLTYCCCLSHKFWIGLDYDNTTLVDCLFSREDFDCSVIHMGHRWKQSCDWRSHRTANVAWIPSRKWELHSYWLTAREEYGLILSSHLWGGVLRDNTKNGCVADWTTSWIIMMQPSTTMMKIVTFPSYLVFDKPHYLKKP